MTETSTASSDDANMTVTICNERGLHARASAKFVQCAEQFDATITVTRDNLSVGGTSIMGLMMLAAGPGATLEISATGREAEAALGSLQALIDDGFGEIEMDQAQEAP